MRTGHHPLEIESGRYIKTPREQRLCKLCMLDVEDEYHFVLKCDRYNGIRNIHLPKSLYQFNILFSIHSADVLLSLAKSI